MKSLYDAALSNTRWLAGVAYKAPAYALKAPVYATVYAIKAPLYAGSLAAKAGRLAVRETALAHGRVGDLARLAMGWEPTDPRPVPLLARAGISLSLAGDSLLAPVEPGSTRPLALRLASALSTLSPLLQAAASLTGAVRPPDISSLGFMELKEEISNAAEISLGAQLSSRGLSLINLARRRALKASSGAVGAAPLLASDGGSKPASPRP